MQRTVVMLAAVLLLSPTVLRAQDRMDMPMSMPGHTMTMPAPAPGATAPAAPPPTGPAPTVVIAPTVEEGKRMLGATVTLNGKPLEGAQVAFFIQRTFGLLNVGQEEADEHGVAAVPFPEGLSGGTTGKLHVLARVVAPAEYAAGAGEITIPADIIVLPDPDPFPRAIWAPTAPIPLILTLAILLGGVWTTFAFVLFQLRAVRRLGHP